MVLIAATVCTKAGKALVSRQFVEMTKARIEGLLAAFPKLMTGGRQHTFVETESVRYVYQPLDKLYMLLITTKASNILEDLETLRLFSRVVPEYCTQLTETEVLNQAFNLLFAFDEIVALGYRESVNLAQVRSFVEMDSHEEKIYQAVRQTQEREAANRMRERAKELQRERLEAAKRGGAPRSHMSFGSGFGSQSMSSASNSEPIAEKIPTTPARDTRPTTRSAMKLGSRGADTESFVSKLRSEGDAVAPAAAIAAKADAKPPAPNQKDVHLRFEERLNLVAGRDGDIQNFELSGLLTLRISNEQFGRIQVHVDNKDTRPLQLQTHPNVDKEAFRANGVIGLKQAQRPFPLHSDVGVLKWRLATNDDKLAPISVNCWPSEGAGGCDVNIEYELEQEHLTLSDVHINIPLPAGNSSVVVHQWEGSYTQKGRTLIWSIPVINNQQRSGSLEFTVTPAIPNDFFPLTVSWTSDTTLALLTATKVTQAEDGSPVDYSQEVSFHPDNPSLTPAFPELANHHRRGLPVSEQEYPWIARVIHSLSQALPHICTASCIEKRVFVTAARCIYNLKVEHTTVHYQNQILYVRALVIPSKPTKQMFDDVGLIVVEDKPTLPGWPTIKTFNTVNRTDGEFIWLQNLHWDEGPHEHYVVGYAADDNMTRYQAPDTTYELTEIKIVIDLALCNELTSMDDNNDATDFWVPCYHSCNVAMAVDNPESEDCQPYHGVEGGAVIDKANKTLIGIATWGGYDATDNNYPLPVGFSVLNSDSYYEDRKCALTIRDSEKLGDNFGYQSLCER